MRTSRPSPEINSGSMADIAFLLLIFFLVTTTISGDVGINRKLPRESDNTIIDYHQRNLLQIMLNNTNEIMVNGRDIVPIDNLKNVVKDFIDNNGDGSCTYCNGKQRTDSSVNPNKAVVSLQSGNLTTYEKYIAVQDEITKAYYELRQVYAKNKFKKEVGNLTKDEMKQVQEAYPFILSEAETR